jgi:hypothetical protein
MKTIRRLSNVRGPAALALAMCCVSAHGDVTLEEQVRVEGEGVMRMINMTARTVTTVSGDRARAETDLQMDSRLMRMFGGSGKSASIIDLDREMVYELDLRKKTYTETTLAEQRAQMQTGIEQMREAQQSQQQGASGIDESECEWTEPTATTERSGESELIAGIRAERVKVVATQSCRDRRSPEQVCDFQLTLDQWLAPEADMAAEALDYYRAYAEKIGLGAVGTRDFSQRVESMFGGYGVWGEAAKHLATAEGYPVRSAMSLAIGGPQCQGPQQAQAAERPATPGVGEVIGGAIGGTLGGMLGRGRDSAARKAAPPPEPPVAVSEDGMVRIMTISSEVVSVSNERADRALFLPPADFRLVRDR